MVLDADRIGPVEYALIAFPSTEFDGRMAAALARLVQSGIVRIIDLTFVAKDPDGTVRGTELDELPAHVADSFADLDGEVEGLLTDDDILQLAAGLEPGTSGVLLVWESVWAAEFAQAVRGSGGRLVLREQVPRETVTDAIALLNAPR